MSEEKSGEKPAFGSNGCVFGQYVVGRTDGTCATNGSCFEGNTDASASLIHIPEASGERAGISTLLILQYLIFFRDSSIIVSNLISQLRSRLGR